MLKLTQRNCSNPQGYPDTPLGKESMVKEGFLEEVTLRCYQKDKQKEVSQANKIGHGNSRENGQKECIRIYPASASVGILLIVKNRKPNPITNKGIYSFTYEEVQRMQCE